jgi:PII-like signaling protein
VDSPERIEAFLPDLDKMVGEGLITIEKVRVIAYRHAEDA